MRSNLRADSQTRDMGKGLSCADTNLFTAGAYGLRKNKLRRTVIAYLSDVSDKKTKKKKNYKYITIYDNDPLEIRGSARACRGSGPGRFGHRQRLKYYYRGRCRRAAVAGGIVVGGGMRGRGELQGGDTGSSDATAAVANCACVSGLSRPHKGL